MIFYRPHIFVVIALTILLSSGWHDAFRNSLADIRFAWQQRSATGEIVLVAIDAPSIEKIGVWPWPRQLHADLLRQLETAGVRDVAFDVDFSTPSDATSDQAFVDALAKIGGSVILPSFQQPETDASAEAKFRVNKPLKQFSDQSWPAAVNVAVEPDGRVRRYQFGENIGGQFLPSMGAVLAGEYANKRPPFLIDFSIRPVSIPKVSYFDVLRGDGATLAALKDKRVIIGATALELGDRFSVPNGAVISGPLLQTLAAESILQNRTLRWTSNVVTLVGLCVISLIMMLSWRRLAASGRVMILIGIAVGTEVFAFFLQEKFPFVFDTSLFHTAICVYMTAIALDEIDFRGLVSRIAENRFQRIAMSLGDGLVCMDSNHLITVWNPGAASIFGCDAEAMIGRRFETICAESGFAEGKMQLLDEEVHAGSQQPGGRMMEFDGRRKNGDVFPVEACISGWQGNEGFHYGAVLRDISVRKREAKRIRYLAEHDPLTGLVNRNTLHGELSLMIAAAEMREGEVTLLILGLDGFQQINNMLGHASGDLVLCGVSERLMAAMGGAGIVSRLSGDEFAVVIRDAEMMETVAQLSERLASTFQDPIQAGSRQHRVKVSIGVACYPDSGRTADEILSNGHLALSRAKATSRGGYVLFEAAIRAELEARLTLEAELVLAAERNEFELFYQPQVHLVDGSLNGVEALIRWRHPVRGLVPPVQFMPVVNSSPISEQIASWVLQTACGQAARWERDGHKLRVGVNLSPSQLQTGDLASAVKETLDLTGLTPSLLELEVTEDILLLDEQRVLETFERIQKLGVRVVFDDFGTGYASLSYLKKFPLDGLKIDKSFVIDLLDDSDDAAIVGSTIGLSKKLNLSVIAEGIEDRGAADLLISMGCEEGQGYYFGRPMPASELQEKFLKKGHDLASSKSGKAA